MRWQQEQLPVWKEVLPVVSNTFRALSTPAFLALVVSPLWHRPTEAPIAFKYPLRQIANNFSPMTLERLLRISIASNAPLLQVRLSMASPPSLMSRITKPLLKTLVLNSLFSQIVLLIKLCIPFLIMHLPVLNVIRAIILTRRPINVSKGPIRIVHARLLTNMLKHVMCVLPRAIRIFQPPSVSPTPLASINAPCIPLYQPVLSVRILIILNRILVIRRQRS